MTLLGESPLTLKVDGDVCKLGEINCFSGGDMMAKRGDDGCHHGSIVHFRVVGKSNVQLCGQIGRIWQCRGIF